MLIVYAITFVCILILIRNAYYTGNLLVNGSFYINKKHIESDQQYITSNLDWLRNRASKLVRIMRREYPNDERVDRLVFNWNNQIHELEHSKKNVFAYNVNKGDQISICMHDENNTYNSLNEMFFVVMHEMAHIMTREYSHNDEFWSSHKLLVSTASKHGLFNNINYNKEPQQFCGHYITHNPTFD